MSFWSSERNPVAAATVLWDIGRALSKLEGEGELVKEQTIFLQKLKNTLEAVNKAMEEDPVPQDLQDNVAAIWKPLLETEVEMLSFMGLDEDLVKSENMESITSKYYMKTAYYQRFSSKITMLQNEVAIPLSNLHGSITTMFPQNLPRSWQTFKKWAVESKHYSDKRLVEQTKEWLRPVSSIEQKYQAYIDNISLSNCEWFFSNQQYIDWYNRLSKKVSPILWISGIHGVGRTQIAARVVQKLREDRRTVAYLFYGEKTLKELDTRSAIVTLCWELLNQFPEDVELLLEVYNQGGEPTETEIQTVFQRICRRRDAVILLDGLDECYKQEKKERQRFCQFLASSNGVCDVIIFSRELEDIKWHLSNCDSIPRISNCEADFWNEIEKIPTRCTAGSKSSEEKEKGVMDAEARSSEVRKEHDIHFPRSREDQYRLYAMLRHRICGSRLPTHIARRIIDEAEYWVKSTSQRGESLITNGVKTKKTVPYLLSDPINGARYCPVRNVIATCSHDKVWRTYPDQDGSYQSSSKYFDLVVRNPDGSISALDIGKDSPRSTIRYRSPRIRWGVEHRKKLYSKQQSWIRQINPGSRLGVVPKATTWVDFAEIVRVEIFSTFILEEHGQHEALRSSEQNREEILVRFWNIRKQIRLLNHDPWDVERALLDAHYKKKKLHFNGQDRDNVQSLEEQNKSLLPFTNKGFSYTQSKLRSPRRPLSVNPEDADQLRPTLVSTVPKHPNKKIILKHSNKPTSLDRTDKDDRNRCSSTSTTFVRMIRELVRPKVRPGYKRLEWTCTCGEFLYGDFEEKTPGSLDQLAARLKQQSGQDSQHGAPASIPQLKKAHTRQANTVGYNMPGGSSSGSNGQNNLASNVAGPSGLQTVKPSPPTALQLCIETGKYKLEMSELARPSPTVSDGELFAIIREKYESTRHSILPTWARFKKPNRATFVKVCRRSPSPFILHD
ncbi:unnamed protein product [Alternaria sp. RS040]